jgi:hypothetical protein
VDAADGTDFSASKIALSVAKEINPATPPQGRVERLSVQDFSESSAIKGLRIEGFFDNDGRQQIHPSLVLVLQRNKVMQSLSKLCKGLFWRCNS